MNRNMIEMPPVSPASIEVCETLLENYRHKRSPFKGIANADSGLVEPLAEFLFHAGVVDYPFLESTRQSGVIQ